MALVLLGTLLIWVVVGVWLLRRGTSEPRMVRRNLFATLAVAIALELPLLVLHAWGEGRVSKRVALLVTPFPGADDPIDATTPQSLFPMIYTVRGDTSQARAELQRLQKLKPESYMLHTTAPPESVMAFYRNPAHRLGWRMIEDDTVAFVLEREGREMFLSATDQGFGRGTLISYEVTQARAKAPR